MAQKFSLKRRAILVLTPFFLVFFLIFAVVLNAAFERSQIESLQRQLMLQVRVLLAEADIDERGDFILSAVQEPRLRSLESDLYAYVLADGGSEPVWQSPTADTARPIDSLNVALANGLLGTSPGQSRFGRVENWFAFSYTVVFQLEEQLETQPGQEQFSVPYTLLIFDEGTEFTSELATFQRILFVGLLITAAVFLVLQYLVLRWLFRPLATLESEVSTIEAGEKIHFETLYPTELSPLTERLNRFIDAERLQKERYKNTLSDLAHSIKTPLAVIRSSLDLQEFDARQNIREQVSRIDRTVRRQLNRGAVAVSDMGAAPVVDAVIVFRRLSDALQKIYAERDLRFQEQLPKQLWLQIPEDEYYELVGNLLDNAFKYAHSFVSVAIDTDVEGSDFACIRIENDSAILSPKKLARLTERGVRQDETADGQGIGLSVAISIVEARAGALQLSQPSAGLTRVEATLPIAKKHYKT